MGANKACCVLPLHDLCYYRDIQVPLLLAQHLWPFFGSAYMDEVHSLDPSLPFGFYLRGRHCSKKHSLFRGDRQVFNTAPKQVELKLLFPQCDPVLSSLWVLSHALHTDVAHVPTQVQEAWYQATQVQYQEIRLEFDKSLENPVHCIVW